MQTKTFSSTDTYKEILVKIREATRVDSNRTGKRISLSVWVNWLKENSNTELMNLGYALEWGCQTGRFANYFPNERLFVYHKNNKLKFRTNLQMVKWFARAVVAQRNFTARTTGSGFEALHQTREKV